MGDVCLRCIESWTHCLGDLALLVDGCLMSSRCTLVERGVLVALLVAGLRCRCDVPVVEWCVLGCVFLCC